MRMGGVVCLALPVLAVCLGEVRAEDRRILAPQLDWFDQWMAENDIEVPDFDALPSMPDLPPLMQTSDGSPITTKQGWAARRDELKEQLSYYFIGHFPKSVPAIAHVELVKEQRGRSVVRRQVALTYKTTPPATITMEYLRPEGNGPFPLFMTQATHRRVGLLALARGYAVCIYPGADSDDQTDGFEAAYPDVDWGRIARRAWLGSRVLDYLLTLDEINPKQVAITGHSRNGKQALIAAAYDERFTAVISSSSGSGGVAPFRFMGEDTYEESVEFMTRQQFTADWFHPRMRFFTGREEKLPVDIHALTALIAPRACLISTALQDGVESSFAVERGYIASREVYRFYDAADAFRIRWREGGHEWDAETAESYLDWSDRAFGRGDAEFPEVLLHQFDWQAWKAKQTPEMLREPMRLDDNATNAQRRAAIEWMLGEKSPQGPARGGNYGAERFHEEHEIRRRYLDDRTADLQLVGFNFGPYVAGSMYYTKGHDEPLPVVIWLHPYSYPRGFVPTYIKDTRIYERLARMGYAVVTFDQLGFGFRQEEGAQFYDRYPHSSKLGRMVADIRSVVDFIRDGDGAFVEPRHPSDEVAHPKLDSKRIYCVGYSLGGMVGLYAAALDERIAGVACYAGITPMRGDTDDQPTGGIRRLWGWYGLLPKLGLYHGREAEIPYDYHDVIKLIAHRPCLVVAPKHDRQADHEDVVDCIKKAHDAEDIIQSVYPDDYNRFEGEQHALVIQWLEKHARAK